MSHIPFSEIGFRIIDGVSLPPVNISFSTDPNRRAAERVTTMILKHLFHFIHNENT